MFLPALLQAPQSDLVTIYLGTLNTAQVVLLAWIGGEQAASRHERERRRRSERTNR